MVCCLLPLAAVVNNADAVVDIPWSSAQGRHLIANGRVAFLFNVQMGWKGGHSVAYPENRAEKWLSSGCFVLLVIFNGLTLVSYFCPHKLISSLLLFPPELESWLAVLKQLEKFFCWNHVGGLWIWIKKLHISKNGFAAIPQEDRVVFVSMVPD